MAAKALPIAVNNHLLSDAPLHQVIPKFRRLTDESRRAVETSGIAVKRGKFTDKENAILTRNWRRFCDDYEVIDPHLLFGYFRLTQSVDERKWAKHMRRECGLHLRLAKGLPQRSLLSIYNRARKMFSGLKKAKDLTEEEYQQLMSLNSENGRNWSEIGEQMLCEPTTVMHIVRNKRKANGANIRHGKWSEKEDKQLMKTIKRWLSDNEKTFEDCEQICWSAVSAKLTYRSDIQCRQHFYDCFYHNVCNPDNSNNKWDRKMDTLKLIYYFKRNNYTHERDIDWDSLKEKFADVVPFNKLCRHWQKLKFSVPEFNSKSLNEIVDYLYEKKNFSHQISDDEMNIINEFCDN